MRLVISVIGLGKVGKYITGLLLSHTQYSFQINVLDNDSRVSGAILDMKHALEFNLNHELVYNSDSLFKNSDFIFHCAGASVPMSQNRMDVCNESIRITESVFKGCRFKKNPKIIVVANPVELVSYITYKLSGLPKENVVGTGTYLDSVRMNYYVKEMLPNLKRINAIMLGEHGSSVFLSEQLSSIEGKSFNAFLSTEQVKTLTEGVKAAASKIKETQGATIYGVSFCAIKVLEGLLNEGETCVPLSSYPAENIMSAIGKTELFLSLPCLISARGIIADEKYHPDTSEIISLKKSASIIAKHIPKKYL